MSSSEDDQVVCIVASSEIWTVFPSALVSHRPDQRYDGNGHPGHHQWNAEVEKRHLRSRRPWSVGCTISFPCAVVSDVNHFACVV